jgi:hypothetical protein
MKASGLGCRDRTIRISKLGRCRPRDRHHAPHLSHFGGQAHLGVGQLPRLGPTPAFTTLVLWLGRRSTRRIASPAPDAGRATFAANDATFRTVMDGDERSPQSHFHGQLFRVSPPVRERAKFYLSDPCRQFERTERRETPRARPRLGRLDRRDYDRAVGAAQGRLTPTKVGHSYGQQQAPPNRHGPGSI